MLNASSIAPSADTPGFTRGRVIVPTELASEIITLSSVLTETVHPTWVSTEAITTDPGVVTTATVEVQTIQAQSVRSTTVSEPATSLSARRTTSSATPPTTSHSRAMETSSLPRGSESLAAMGSTNSHTSERDVAPAVSDSSNSSPTVTVNPSSWTFASDAQITAASASSFQPPSSPASSPSADVTSASTAASTNSSKQSQSTSPHVATIVGSAVGSAAFVTVFLLACFLFFRRRRQRPEYLRRPSRQRLLGSRGSGGSISSTHGSHTRQYSQPSLPIPQSPFIPSAPVFSPNRRCSSPLNHQLHPAFAGSNQELAMERLYLRGESEGPRGEDILADPESSAASLGAQVSPPSRTASSTYSQSSWEDDIRLLDYYESVPQVSIYESTYYAGGSTLTLPSVGFPVPNYLDTPKTRFDARSDPFDLEAPPKALRKGPPIAPHPTPWGVNF